MSDKAGMSDNMVGMAPKYSRPVNLGCLPRGQQPNKQGYKAPVENCSSRLTQMMKEHARKNGVLWPYF